MMTFTAKTVEYTKPSGDAIRVTLGEAPRQVPRTETGPARDGWKVRGVAEFVSGPCFDKFGAHRTSIDLGLTAADVLAWQIASAGTY